MISNIIKALLGIIVPALFTIIIAEWSNFPLTVEQLLALAFWIVGLIYAGNRTAVVYALLRSRYR